MAKVENLSDHKKPEADGTGKMPSAAVLEKHAKGYGLLKSDADAIRGDMGALLKNAQNDDNVHRKAFKLALQIRRMDDSESSAFLAHFDHYREQMKLDRATLPLDEAPANDGAAGQSEQPADKPAASKGKAKA